MIKNSKVFVEGAKTWDIDPDEIQVSYDVVALYPSVPIKKAISNLMEMIQKDYNDFKTRTILKLELSLGQSNTLLGGFRSNRIVAHGNFGRKFPTDDRKQGNEYCY